MKIKRQTYKSKIRKIMEKSMNDVMYEKRGWRLKHLPIPYFNFLQLRHDEMRRSWINKISAIRYIARINGDFSCRFSLSNYKF